LAVKAVGKGEETWQKTLQLLIDKGVNLNEWGAQQALPMATEADKGEKVLKLLVDNGVDVKTSKGGEALWKASRRGNTAMVRLLVEKGASVDAEYDGKRVIYIATENRRWKVVEQLVEANADITKPDSEDYTVLQLAEGERGAENIVALLEKL